MSQERKGPLCYFCAGRMVRMNDIDEEYQKEIVAEDETLQSITSQKDEVYICPDCEAVLYRGYPQSVIDRNIEEELRARERGMMKKRGSHNSRKRKKPQKPWGRSYPNIDTMR